MSETEQLVAEALRALEHAPGLSWDEKRKIASRIEDMAAKAWQLFTERDDAESEAAWDEIQKRWSKSA